MRTEHRAFTLLEVMVAVAILGLSLTVILSAQVGLFASGTYGQHLGEATGLARCRMTELEEQFLKLGYPEVDTKDDGACCGGDLRQDMRCAWLVERIELPNPPLGGGADGGVNPAGSGGLDFGAGPAGSAASTLGPLSALAQATGALPGGLGGTSQPGGTSGLSSVLAAGAQGGTGALAPMVMGFVYPSLKPMLEASIRKVTVKVLWREGLAKRELEIIQWVTNPMRGGFLAGALGSDSAVPGAGTPPAGGIPTRGGLNPPPSIPGGFGR